MPIAFIKDFLPHYGQAVTLSPMIRRLTARNASAFTFKGTNSYILGQDILAIIDPGPDDAQHFADLMKNIANKPVRYIFVTHCHIDHSSLALRLSLATGAKIVAEGPYRLSRNRHIGETTTLDASSQTDFIPDITLKDGESIDCGEFSLSLIATPGHMANHAAFALDESGILFSGDHVMAWSTTIVAPPDGSMQDYMESLDKLLYRNDLVYLPGHGGPVYKPHKFVRAIKAHRKMREKAILHQLSKGSHSIKEIVKIIYRDTNPSLHAAATLSVFSQLEYLILQGKVKTKGVPSLDSFYYIS